ncbi:MAG: hypothetical protein DMF84_17930 [Acidobacteria bacterium]|nr:MAG: hypothetical protein DMF84_17930 [Acidobacteriota bacterium]
MVVQRVDLFLKTYTVLAMAGHIRTVTLERRVIPSKRLRLSKQPGVFLRQRFFSHVIYFILTREKQVVVAAFASAPGWRRPHTECNR